MRLDILLEPSGAEADSVLQEWLMASDLQLDADGQIVVAPDRCLEVLVALRSRCYDRGLTVNVNFAGEKD